MPESRCCRCMILFTKYPRYLELGVENMDFKAVKWWQAPIDAAPSSSCPCDISSSTLHPPVRATVCQAYTRVPLLLRTSALISPTAAAVVCGRGQKMVLSRMLSTLESILDVVRQEAARHFFCIIFAMQTPQQSTKRVNNI